MSQPNTSASEVVAVAPTARQSYVSSRKSASAAGNDSDRTLIAAVARHDQAAFRELHLHYARRIARFVSKRFPSCVLVEEIISDTLWIVWQTAGRFKGGSKVSTWIMGIAYRLSPRPFMRGDRGNHELPRRHRQDSHVPRPPEVEVYVAEFGRPEPRHCTPGNASRRSASDSCARGSLRVSAQRSERTFLSKAGKV
jgi:hypothetical protein